MFVQPTAETRQAFPIRLVITKDFKKQKHQVDFSVLNIYIPIVEIENVAQKLYYSMVEGCRSIMVTFLTTEHKMRRRGLL